MGGERASTTRMRLSGKICAICRNSLPEPHTPGERLCAKCTNARSPRRRVYMYFMLNHAWHCQFLEADLKTPLPRTLNLSTPEKVFELASRGGCNLNQIGRQIGRASCRERV